MIVGATFSPCGKYRYELWRDWDHALPMCVFVMLNPSYGDTRLDDPTIRRCIGFAKRLGFGGFTIYNLFTFVSSDPRDLARVADPIGFEADRYLLAAKKNGAKIIVAWGANGDKYKTRVRAVRELLAGYALFSLGTTKSGQPNHPLMLSYSTPLTPWLRGDLLL